MLPYIFFVIGFIVLIKGAGFLVEGSTSIARNLKISYLVIGLTVVAFGTSSPELFVNIIASVKGNPAIAIGNVIGSNIANIFLILGVSSIIFPLSLPKGTVWKEIPLSLLAGLLLGVLINDQLINKSRISALTRIDGLVFISLFIIFIYYSFSIAKNIEGMSEHIPTKQYGLIKSSLLVITGFVGLGLGAKWIVDGAIHIALTMGISQSLVGLTLVAVSTSLPELATSVVAACKRHTEIAVGNVVGSNIFNIFFVLGISSIVKPLPIQAKNNVDISVLILANLLLFVTMFTGKKHLLDRWEGILFIILYVSYIAFIIVRG